MGVERKSLLAVGLVIVLAAAAVLCYVFLKPDTAEGAKTVTVEITHLDGASRTVELHTDALYLWDAMEEQGLIEGTDSQYGKWVTAVDGETADETAGQYWVFTKAGQWVDTSCDTTHIADGETYEFYIYLS